jgi:uncharacterized membrane protein/mono/diheme cytochrome c family protein
MSARQGQLLTHAPSGPGQLQWLWLLMILGGCPHVGAADAQTDVSAGGSAFYLERIQPLLEENCLRCHGPTRQRSGLRLDSRAMVLHGGHGPIVVLGDPAHSRLIDAISYEDEDVQMPPAGKLSDSEIADLTRWVQMGVPWGEAAAVVPRTMIPVKASVPAIVAKDRSEMMDTHQSPVPTWFFAMMSRAGKLHPLIVHFPIALLLTACLAEGLALLSLWRHQGEAAVRMASVASFCLTLAVVAGVVAAVLGWWFAWSVGSEVSSFTLEWHRWMGISTTAVAALALVCSWLGRTGDASKVKAWYRVLLFLSAIGVAITGHLGGKMVFG